MEHFICDDFNGSKWVHDGVSFVKKDKNDVVLYALSESNIPNPHKLWANRCNYFSVPIGTDYHEGVRLKPTDAVFFLFDYKEALNGNKNA